MLAVVSTTVHLHDGTAAGANPALIRSLLLTIRAHSLLPVAFIPGASPAEGMHKLPATALSLVDCCDQLVFLPGAGIRGTSGRR